MCSEQNVFSLDIFWTFPAILKNDTGTDVFAKYACPDYSV